MPWAEHSGDLRDAIKDGKRIIITTIEKFPYVVPDIGAKHKDNKFAVIIDEAHSGQSGRNSAQMNLALSGLASEDEMDNEDKINAMMRDVSYSIMPATLHLLQHQRIRLWKPSVFHIKMETK